ncbi:unnamed protein product [Discosporangium mesarthrocarpum]
MGWTRLLTGLAVITAVLPANVWAQNITTETCSSDACGITSCPAGAELNVGLIEGQLGIALNISCEPCVDGFFKTATGSDKCSMCEDGMDSTSDHTGCLLLPGFWRISLGEEVVCTALCCTEWYTERYTVWYLPHHVGCMVHLMCCFYFTILVLFSDVHCMVFTA